MSTKPQSQQTAVSSDRTSNMFRAGLRALRTNFRPLQKNTQLRAYRQQRFGDTRPRSRGNLIFGLLARWAAKPTFYRDVMMITAGSGAFYVYNLEQVPVSGRRRFNVVTPNMEAWMGKQTVDAVKEEYEDSILPEWDPRVQQVKKVLARLLPYAQGEGMHDVEWEVNVIDSPEQNAFVAPG
jgi:hypothetical protein